MVFRSIVIPAKAIAMNLLSVGAAYGLIVLVSLEGIGAGLLGFQESRRSSKPWLPLFLFAVLFGLSMDYQVFLLSRIKEPTDRPATTRPRSPRASAHGRHHHRRGADHGRRVRRLRRPATS